MIPILMKALQLIVALALLVIIHEFGHYLMARIFGIKVEKFYLFFNPWFSIAKWKPKKKKVKYDKNGVEKASWRDTEYGIGWLPLGGYVKIAGMIDESMDKEQLAQPAQPTDFRAKPAWQRLLVMIGGVTFNFILAILIYIGIAFHWGAEYIPLENATEGMEYCEEARKLGFQNGDIPLLADGHKLDASKNFPYEMATAREVKVLRNHKDTVSIAIPENFALTLSNAKQTLLGYRVPVYVAKIQGGSAASKAGMEEGDHIVAVNGVPTPGFTELTQQLVANGGKEVTVSVERDGRTLDLKATPTEGGKLGFQLRPITEIYEPVVVNYSLWEAVPKGIVNGTEMLTNYVGSMKYLFTKEGSQSIGGFGAIGSMFPDRWNWLSFWQITAFISVALAFINILPIPALDGGHVMFLLYEMVMRKPAPEKVMEYAQIAGMAFLLLLMLYANGLDAIRSFAN